MNKRLEDRIIELAFEERSESGAAEVAKSPEAAARLLEYRTMRSALGQLRELPEHQLSTERMRQALLHRGLKRRRAFPWQGLGYLAVAAGFFVCAFFVSKDVRRAIGPAPKIEGGGMAANAATPASPTYDFNPLQWASSNTAAPDESAPVGVAPRLHAHALHNDYAFAEHDRPASRLANMVVESNPRGRITPGSSPDPSAAHPKNLTKSANSVPLSSAMVLIQPQTDADTGLDTAKEVSASGDVLVGG